MAYLFNGNLEKSTPLFEQAVNADPTNYELRMAYARALRDQKKYAPAALEFFAASKIKPDDLAAVRELGVVLYLAGDYPKALTAFEKSRQLGDQTPGNCFLRAIILDKLEQKKPALEAYQQFLALSQGKNPDQEWQAQQRAKLLQRELERR